MKKSNWKDEREKRRREYPPPRGIVAVEPKKKPENKPENKPSGSPLSFKIRPPESSAKLDLNKTRPVVSMALVLSAIGVVLFMGFIAALLWIQEGGALPSASNNAADVEKQSAIPQSQLPSPGVRATATQAARTSQAPARSASATRSSNVKPAAGATATKTSAGRKAAPSATVRPSATAIPRATIVELPTAPPKATLPRVPTATRVPPTPYPTSGPPPPPGTCILGCG